MQRHRTLAWLSLVALTSCYASGPQRADERRHQLYHQRARFLEIEHHHGTGVAVAAGLVGLLAATIASSPRERDDPHAASPHPAPTRTALPGVRPTITRVESQRGPLLRMRIPLLGGYVQLAALPAKYPSEALLNVHFVQRLAPSPCRAQLYRDGQALALGELARPSNYELTLTVRLTDLRSLGASDRFAGELCGARFSLDRPARESVAEFEAAVREEQVMLDLSSPVVAPPP